MSITEAVIQKLNVLPLEKQEQVLHYVESLIPAQRQMEPDPYAWLTIAAGMNLDGPPDLSEHLDNYLYRNGDQPQE